ncbi:alpha-L-rhamnosidase [Spirochaeta isovalerica]|uniref:alpha-L-rhamnosidase n=1 Tax=Spirochaeta isovalerica TaxID=150 RepID=A0A841R7V4_9SPIO|nr:alpha-L-rhamnosidase [Spirochaeta isovalerica]MBB6479945.1 alpha-L-rhamnosidase [Spirochaeta isovalerica]
MSPAYAADFSRASWIGKKHHIKENKRQRLEGNIHYVSSSLRRFADRAFEKLGYENRKYLKAPYFRKTVELSEIESAEVCITGLGYFEFYVNGHKIGDDVLSPPYSQYEKTTYYLTYDIAPYLKAGKNIIGVILGNGMYNVHLKNAWNYDTAHWRGLPRFIMTGIIKSGRDILLDSDASWKTASGPIISDDIFGGECYDARLELAGWQNPDYDDSHWENAVLYSSPTEALKPLDMPPMKIIREIEPVEYWKIGERKWVFDLGVNIAGFVRLKGSAPAGTEVLLTHGEKLEGRELDMMPLYEHTAEPDKPYLQRDRYIFKGRGLEEWHPRFTYHGFQYVEVDGLESVDKSTITGLEVHSDLEQIGNFSCSDDLLNKIFLAGNQSNLNNFQGIPTDCPHREKNGWTGDVNLSIDYNLLCYNSDRVLKKWIYDIVDAQSESGRIPAIAPTPGWGYEGFSGPAWDSSFIIIPWHIYFYRGDKVFLESVYDPMKKYMSWQSGKAKNHIIHYGLGDWCSPGRIPHKPKCPPSLTSTAFFYESARLMAKIAEAVGRKGDADNFGNQAEKIRKAFNRAFVNQESGFVKGDCQTSYSATLFYGLIDESLKSKVFERLVDQVEKQNFHLDTGILGTKYLLEVLSRHGRGDLAMKIATQRDFPGWGMWIEQGATTLWENWNGEQSRNHRMFGSISSWFLTRLAGIQIEDAAFRKVIIQPDFNNHLTSAEGRTRTPFGELSVRWEREKGKLNLYIEAPDEIELSLCLDENFQCEVIYV